MTATPDFDFALGENANMIRDVTRRFAEFESKTGIKVELRFGPSEALLSSLKTTKIGDLFIPADHSYVEQAREAGLVEQSFELAGMTGVAIFREKYSKPAKDSVARRSRRR